MKTGLINSFFWLLMLSMIWCGGCGKDDNLNSNGGHLILDFKYVVDGSQIEFNQMKYTNSANNKYEVTEIQWFISDVTLHKLDGRTILLDSNDFAHYADTNIPSTQRWEIADLIPVGEYDAITVTFGIKGEKNKPMMYLNPPESDMMWPINLGGEEGGYHYMKMNGFWMNPDNERTPFNFHLGVGQQYDDQKKVIGFIQNWFEITLANSAFSMSKGETKLLLLDMNVQNWFQNPNIYDFNVYGAKIMQNQEAMHAGCENGQADVFCVESLKTFSE